MRNSEIRDCNSYNKFIYSEGKELELFTIMNCIFTNMDGMIFFWKCGKINIYI
jgi:hypothetical protein